MSTAVPDSGQAIDVKRAVQIARDAVVALFGSEMQDNARLEEVELSDDSDYWFITMSFLRKAQRDEQSTPDLFLLNTPIARAYKRVAISAKDGNVKAISIRSINE